MRGSSTLHCSQSNSQQRFTRGTGSVNIEPYQEALLSNTAGRPSHQRDRSRPGKFVIAEDQEDETLTTQDTSSTVILSQRDVNSQSQERLLIGQEPREEPDSSTQDLSASIHKSSDHTTSRARIEMSGTNHTASAMDTSRRPSLKAERLPLGERLKRMRAEAQARQAAWPVDTDMSDAGTPPTVLRSPREAARTQGTIRSDQPDTPQPTPQPIAAKSDGQGLSTSYTQP